MSRSLAFLAIGFIAATASAGWLWHELQAEQRQMTTQRARMQMANVTSNANGDAPPN